MKRKLGWIPDEPDFRDYPFRRVTRKAIKKSVDLRAVCPPVEDQGNLGSCTAHAGVAIYEIQEVKSPQQWPTFVDKSRLGLYFCIRDLQWTTPWDSGGTLRNTARAMAQFGLWAETLWPYLIKKFAVRPPTTCYADGEKHKIVEYQRIVTLDELLACLSDGFPVMFGFTVYSSMLTDAVDRTGVIPYPKRSDNKEGGHAVAAVGYTEKEYLVIRNSWGDLWGQLGYGFMPFDYVRKKLATDFWVVRKQL